jgi:hypothetical protein
MIIPLALRRLLQIPEALAHIVRLPVTAVLKALPPLPPAPGPAGETGTADLLSSAGPAVRPDGIASGEGALPGDVAADEERLDLRSALVGDKRTIRRITSARENNQMLGWGFPAALLISSPGGLRCKCQKPAGPARPAEL